MIDGMSTAASPPSESPPPRRPRWSSTEKRVVGVALAVVAGFVGYFIYDGLSDWARAEAETDRLDPRWRLEVMEADRKTVFNDENAALLCIALNGRWGTGFRALPNYDELFDYLPRNRRLNEKQEALLRKQQGLIAKALDEARKLKDMPTGRLPIETKSIDGALVMLYPHHHCPATCADMLYHDAILQTHDGETALALDGCHALFNTGRALGEGPDWMAHFWRKHSCDMTVDLLERILGQGDVSDDRLRAMQSLLAEEASRNHWHSFLRAMRAERHWHFENVKYGRSTLEGMQRYGLGDSNILAFRVPLVWRYYFPDYLRNLNRLVEIGKLPLHEQGEKLKTLESDNAASSNPLIRQVSFWRYSYFESECRVQARLRCAVTALAAERYRLQFGRFPPTLDALVDAKLLDAVPLDPIDGQTLRYRHKIDHIVIYSLDVDGFDDGGIVEVVPDQFAPRYDVGFRLWHPAHRGLPPR